MLELDLEKAEKLEMKLPISTGSSKQQKSAGKTSTSALFIDYTFDCVDHNKLWKILQEMGIPYHLTWLLRNLYAVKKQQLEPDMEQQTGFKLGKEYVKVVYCHPAYLTYM